MFYTYIIKVLLVNGDRNAQKLFCQYTCECHDADVRVLFHICNIKNIAWLLHTPDVIYDIKIFSSVLEDNKYRLFQCWKVGY